MYGWHVKQGNVVIQKNEDRISLQLNYENGNCCLLAPLDADEIIEILTELAQQIWESPGYEKKPYTDKLYKKTDDEYSWEIGTSTLLVKFNRPEYAIEIKCSGSKNLELEINYLVEIIQILEHVNG